MFNLKLLIETSNKNDIDLDCDGIILPLKDYSVESITYYTLDEIEVISKKTNKEIFIKINKNLMNKDIPNIKDILIKLDKIKISGIFFYDLAILQLVRELNLSINLVWNQTHMVNNYKTCDYYYSKGIKYALLGKEITLEEIQDIIRKSKINCMVEVVSKPSVAVSYRHLITNYYKDLGKTSTNKLQINHLFFFWFNYFFLKSCRTLPACHAFLYYLLLVCLFPGSVFYLVPYIGHACVFDGFGKT